MDFLTKTATQIIAQHGNNLHHLHIVLPTHRACYFFRKALTETAQTLWLPQISTLSDWVENISAMQKIEVLEELMLLHQFYSQTGRTETLDEFLHFGRTLCSDFEELDMHLVRMEWFFKELMNLASMKVYEPATELNTSQLDYLKFWERFEKLYRLLRTQLLAENKGNLGMMFRKGAENIETLGKELNNFYFIGFDGLTKAEETIIKYLHAHNKATVIWDTDKYYVEHPKREAGYFFRKYFDTWKGNMQYCESQILVGKKEIEIVSVARSVGQAKVAVEIIANQLKITKDNAAKTAIILPDEKLLQALQYLLPSSLGKYNLTMGLPIARSLAGEFFLLLFKLHESAERVSSRRKKHKIYHKDLIAFLQHPFLKIHNKELNTQSVISAIRKNNLVFIERNYFENNHQEINAETLDILYHSQDSIHYLKSIATLCNHLINAFKQKNKSEKQEKNSAIHLEFLLKILDAINAVLHALSDAKLQPKTIRALLSDEFKNYRVPFEGEPAEGLQIMGLMESRCLDFENVIILSSNEGVLPSGKISKSYIPYPLRNEALFSHHDKESKTAYLFYRLLHKAKKIFLLYDTEGTQIGGGEKSRYILQLQYELIKEAPNIALAEKVYSVAPPEIKPAIPIEVLKTEIILEKIKSIATKGLSPSALNTYINCSLQYYFKYIANLKEPDEVEEDMESNTMGSAIHFVLENLYRDLIGKEITVEWLENIRKDKAGIKALLQEGFKAKFDESALAQGKNHLYFQISLKMIDTFLNNEIKRVKDGKKISIEALETNLEATLEVDDTTVKIKGISDRIERENETLTIVDFKSGSASSAVLKNSKKGDEYLWVASDPKFKVQFQLLIYAWTYLQMNPHINFSIQSGIFWLRKTNDGLDNLSINGNSLLNRENLQTFENLLIELLQELLNPAIPFKQTDDLKRCQYCAYKRICKRE